MPLQVLQPHTSGEAAGGWYYLPIRRGTALFGGVVEPSAQQADRSLQVVEPDIQIALLVVAVLSDEVGTRAVEVSNRHSSYTNIQVFNACAVATHIQRIEVVDLDMLPAIVPLPRPELGIWLNGEQISTPHKRFAQAELIVAVRVRKVRVGIRVRRVGFDHKFGLEPCLARNMIRVDPIVDEDHLAIRLGFVAQPVLRSGTRRLKRNHLAAHSVGARAGPKISMKLKAVHLFRQLLDLLLSFVQQIVGGLRRKLALILLPNLVRLTEHCSLGCLSRKTAGG